MLKWLGMVGVAAVNLTLCLKVLARSNLRNMFNTSLAIMFGLQGIFAPLSLHFYFAVRRQTLISCCKKKSTDLSWPALHSIPHLICRHKNDEKQQISFRVFQK